MTTSAAATSLVDLEATGAKFSTKPFLEMRQMTRLAVNDIASRVNVGMVEEDAVEMARDILAEAGMVRGWHDVYVRFGTNTTKTFGEASDPGVVLGADTTAAPVAAARTALTDGPSASASEAILRRALTELRRDLVSLRARLH